MCGGIIKPDVVFFGENVAPQVVELAQRAVQEAGRIVTCWAVALSNARNTCAAEPDAMLVVGTTLATWSAYRLIRQAKGKPARPARTAHLPNPRASANCTADTLSLQGCPEAGAHAENQREGFPLPSSTWAQPGATSMLIWL